MVAGSSLVRTIEPLKVWNLRTGVCLNTFIGHTDAVAGLAISPDSRLAVSASWDKTLRVWDLRNGACLRSLIGHTAKVHVVKVTPDNNRVISGADDGTLRLWELASGHCQAIFQTESGVGSVALSADGSRLVVGSLTGQVFTLHLENLKPDPPIVTAWQWQNLVAFGCPCCNKWSQIPIFFVGNGIICPLCNSRLYVNPFLILGDWRPVAATWQQKLKPG